MNILYVASDTRSGSTMLDYILGDNPHVVSVGEIRFLHSHIVESGVGHSYGWKCSCGEKLKQCDFWGAVIREYESEGRNVEKDETSYIQRKSGVLSNLALLVALYLPIENLRKIVVGLTQTDGESVTNLTNTLRYMHLIANTDFVLDSSKKGRQLSCLIDAARDDSSTEVKVIHLMRDPRATVWSKVRRKGKTDSLIVYLRSMVGWVLQNAEISIARSLVDQRNWVTIRYEDLCSDTDRVIASVCEQFDLPKHETGGEIIKDSKHNICGSPTRFDRGKSQVSLEVDWIKKYGFFQKMIYVIFAWPFLGVLGYGYRNYYKK